MKPIYTHEKFRRYEGWNDQFWCEDRREDGNLEMGEQYKYQKIFARRSGHFQLSG